MAERDPGPNPIDKDPRAAVFAGYMEHYGFDESDQDDQDDATAVTDAIMRRLAPVLATERAKAERTYQNAADGRQQAWEELERIAVLFGTSTGDDSGPDITQVSRRVAEEMDAAKAEFERLYALEIHRAPVEPVRVRFGDQSEEGSAVARSADGTMLRIEWDDDDENTPVDGWYSLHDLTPVLPRRVTPSPALAVEAFATTASNELLRKRDAVRLRGHSHPTRSLAFEEAALIVRKLHAERKKS